MADTSFAWLRTDPLARVEPETLPANNALRDYANMGPGRSLTKLLDRYRSVSDPCPTKRRPTLVEWSTRFDWQGRVTAHDGRQQAALAAAALDQRMKAQAKRIQVLEAAQGVVTEKLVEVRKEQWKPGEVMQGLIGVTRRLSEEYGDDPVSKALETLYNTFGPEKGARLVALVAELAQEGDGG